MTVLFFFVSFYIFCVCVLTVAKQRLRSTKMSVCFVNVLNGLTKDTSFTIKRCIPEWNACKMSKTCV